VCAGSLFSGLGHQIKEASCALPQLHITHNAQPLTGTIVRVTLTITPDFHWTDRVRYIVV
jgi:hypothetical protein